MTDLAGVLAVLCPMHVMVSAQGRITSAGRTLCKVLGPTEAVGARFLELFEVQRPAGLVDFAGLSAAAGRKVTLRLRQRRRTAFQGIAAQTEDGGLVLNLSFGLTVIDAVRDHALSAADFSPTDLAVEMLYLVEAKSLAMEASRHLNMRLRSAMVAAEEQAFTDTLTGLKNRRALDHVLARLLRQQRPLAVLSLDLDFFKEINDTHGHAAGDAMLQHVARAMLDETREDDTLARVGGDEFTLLLPGVTRPEPARELTRRLIARIETPLRYGPHTLQVSASVGIALSNQMSAPTAETLAAAADRALYGAKHAGRGRFQLFSPHADTGAAPVLPLDRRAKVATRPLERGG